MGKFLSNDEFKKRVQDLTNNEYTVISPYIASSIKVKIKHNNCDNVYEVTPNNFLKGRRCPYCAGKRVIADKNSLEAKGKELLSEWDYKENKISPREISVYSNKKAHWICEKGHKWEASPNSRMRGVGCPTCHREKNLKYSTNNHSVVLNILEQNNLRGSPDVRFDDCRWDRPIPFSMGVYKKDKLVGLIDYRTRYYSLMSRDIKQDYCKERNIDYIFIELTNKKIGSDDLKKITNWSKGLNK